MQCNPYQDSNGIFYRSKKTTLKFMFLQAILLPMISPLPEQADFIRSFTAMYLKMLGIKVEFESPHGMAGSGENWRGTPMTGCWWMCPVPQTATPFMRRRTTFFSGRERRSGRCYLCCRCSFLRLDFLPQNQEATLSIPPAHSHTYRTSMWFKVPSSSWPINITSKFGWKI